jgi:hypothetical protein
MGAHGAGNIEPAQQERRSIFPPGGDDMGGAMVRRPPMLPLRQHGSIAPAQPCAE